MEDNIENTPVEEVITQEQVEAVEVAPDVQEEPKAKPNSQEFNLRELRAGKAKAEREREELSARLAKYEQQQPQEKIEDIGALRDDDLIEGKHLKAIQKQLKSFQAQQKEVTDETRLKAKYGDFDKVVNDQNIQQLKESDPEFAETIALSSSSLYSRGSSTYRRIKDLGIYVEDSHIKEKAAAQANASKPRSMNSVSPQSGDNPLTMANAFANGLTDDLKKQLWKEMNDAAKRS